MNQQNLKVGEEVKIIKGPIDKVGKVGKVTMLMGNGAIVKLSNDTFTPIKFIHLEKVLK